MSWGNTIKKELATMSIALDLPKSNPLRGTIEEFKKRFEDYSDEHTVATFSHCWGELVYPSNNPQT
jgi:hypothetical protein